ncbi:MAG: STAS domain-containing protein [Actinomycetes bacterium]
MTISVGSTTDTDVDITAPDDASALPGLSVTADPGRHACRLRLIGRLDADTVPMFTACLTSWVDRGISRIVIDMTAVTAVDAAGATSLAHATHVVTRHGGSVHVTARPELTHGPLAGSGLDFIDSGVPGSSTVIGVSNGR